MFCQKKKKGNDKRAGLNRWVGTADDEQKGRKPQSCRYRKQNYISRPPLEREPAVVNGRTSGT